MDDQNFVDAGTTRELTKSIIKNTFKKDTDAIFENTIRSAVPPYLQSAIDSARIGSYRATLIASVEEHLFGHDELSRNVLKRLFDSTDKFSIKSLFENLYAGLAVIETGSLSRRTADNIILIELSARFATSAAPSSSSHPDWHGEYITGYLIGSLKGIVSRLDSSATRANDAIKLNLGIPRNLDAMNISASTFDFLHFVFDDNFTQDASESKIEFQKIINDLYNQKDIASAISYPNVYTAIKNAWPYIYDLRDTYITLMELAKLQPEESYPESNPEILEVIRSTIKMADNSWHL